MLFQSVTMDFPLHFRYALKLFKHVCALLLSFTRLLHFCIAERVTEFTSVLTVYCFLLKNVIKKNDLKNRHQILNNFLHVSRFVY